jgi:hypothetical protein
MRGDPGREPEAARHRCRTVEQMRLANALAP